MKSLAGILVVFALYLPLPALADRSAIEGTWISGDGDGLIEVRVNDGTLEGIILGSASDDTKRASTDEKNPDPKLRNRPLIGLNLFKGFAYDGKGRWSGGFIYDPNNGKTYRCKVHLVSRDRLKVRGFIGVSIIGRTETWQRKAN